MNVGEKAKSLYDNISNKDNTINLSSITSADKLYDYLVASLHSGKYYSTRLNKLYDFSSSRYEAGELTKADKLFSEIVEPKYVSYFDVFRKEENKKIMSEYYGVDNSDKNYGVIFDSLIKDLGLDKKVYECNNGSTLGWSDLLDTSVIDKLLPINEEVYLILTDESGYDFNFDVSTMLIYGEDNSILTKNQVSEILDYLNSISRVRLGNSLIGYDDALYEYTKLFDDVVLSDMSTSGKTQFLQDTVLLLYLICYDCESSSELGTQDIFDDLVNLMFKQIHKVEGINDGINRDYIGKEDILKYASNRFNMQLEVGSR